MTAAGIRVDLIGIEFNRLGNRFSLGRIDPAQGSFVFHPVPGSTDIFEDDLETFMNRLQDFAFHRKVGVLCDHEQRLPFLLCHELIGGKNHQRQTEQQQHSHGMVPLAEEKRYERRHTDQYINIHSSADGLKFIF